MEIPHTGAHTDQWDRCRLCLFSLGWDGWDGEWNRIRWNEWMILQYHSLYDLLTLSHREVQISSWDLVLLGTYLFHSDNFSRFLYDISVVCGFNWYWLTFKWRKAKGWSIYLHSSWSMASISSFTTILVLLLHRSSVYESESDNPSPWPSNFVDSNQWTRTIKRMM